MSDDNLPLLPRTTTIDLAQNQTIPPGYEKTIYATLCDNRPIRRLPPKPNKDRSAPFRKFFK
jgi:hypothetical protein